MATHFYFESFIIIAIIISTMSLTFQSPLNDPDSGIMQFWAQVDLVTTIIFTFECSVKITQAPGRRLQMAGGGGGTLTKADRLGQAAQRGRSHRTRVPARERSPVVTAGTFLLHALRL